jgi:hypothetical protein
MPTPLPQFQTSTDCTGHAHCRSCRNRKSNFRRVMAVRFTLPGGVEDFECPYGRPWNGEQPKGPVRGLGDVVAAVTKAVGIRPCGGCAKRQAALNKLVPFKGASPPAS